MSFQQWFARKGFSTKFTNVSFIFVVKTFNVKSQIRYVFEYLITMSTLHCFSLFSVLTFMEILVGFVAYITYICAIINTMYVVSMEC